MLNATTARLFAKIAGVYLKKSEGILIVGASKVSQLIGQYLEDNDRHVVLIDSNLYNIAKANELGLDALNTNIYSDNLKDNIELNDIGYLMALTGNSDINKFSINKFGAQFGENGSFRLITVDEMNNPENNPKEGLFSHTDDFISLTEVARNYPAIHEIIIKDKEHYEKLIEITNNDTDIIPIFLKNLQGELEIISSYNTEINDVGQGWKLVYLGKLL